MKKLKFIGILVFTLVLMGCEKDPGEGGTASIKGTVNKEFRLVLSNPATTQYMVAAADEDVYIVYGDNISPDDRIYTNYNGEYEFRNLRKGKYTIYVYSKDNTGTSGVDQEKMVVKQEIEIQDKGQAVEAETMIIYDVP
jgi:hypothetical protein